MWPACAATGAGARRQRRGRRSGPRLVARVSLAGPAGVREGGDEPVALARDRGDEARVPVVVLELDPQAPDVAVDDVALGDEVGTPDRVEDLVPRDHPTPAAGEQVQQALLDPGPVSYTHLRLPT